MVKGTKEQREALKAASIQDLVHHILAHCHLEARQDMALLETRAEHAVLLEGRACPELVVIRDQIEGLCSRLRAHLAMEERTVFPLFLEVAEGRATPAQAEALGRMRKVLEDDHESEAGLLRNIRNITQGPAALEDAHGIHAALREALHALAENLQWHLYLENQILFQKAFLARS